MFFLLCFIYYIYNYSIYTGYFSQNIEKIEKNFLGISFHRVQYDDFTVSANPLDPEHFTVFASEVCPPYTYTVAYRVVPLIAAIEVDIVHVVGEPAARAVFAFIY